MPTRSRFPALLAAVGALVSSYALPASATMTADVNCRAWGARYDAPALLDRMLSRKPAPRVDLIRRVCKRSVPSATMSILEHAPKARKPRGPRLAVTEARFTAAAPAAE